MRWQGLDFRPKYARITAPLRESQLVAGEKSGGFSAENSILRIVWL
jgi:hypothetical protein